MDIIKYRIVVSYIEERHIFRAFTPEFEGCEVEAPTRAEAVAKFEEELNAQVENMQEQGIEPPQPIDEQQFDGKLNLTITPALHRDLVFMAKAEQVELDVYLAEVLTRSLSSRTVKMRPRGEGRMRREGQTQRYHDIMENREDFIEYVRRLDSGGRTGNPRNKPRNRQNSKR